MRQAHKEYGSDVRYSIMNKHNACNVKETKYKEKTRKARERYYVTKKRRMEEGRKKERVRTKKERKKREEKKEGEIRRSWFPCWVSSSRFIALFWGLQVTV